MRILAQSITFFAAIVAGGVSAPALADPAALILEISGTVSPEVGLYDEIDGGTVLELAQGASLTISHYGACEEVALTGGSVSVGTAKLGLDAAQVQSRTDVRCPDQIVMAAADLINMSVTLRSAKQVTVMAPQPDFVLPGAWGKQFDSLAVHGRDGRMASMAVVGGHAAWPADEPPLTVGDVYVIVLNGPGAQQHAARIEVTADPLGITVLKGK